MPTEEQFRAYRRVQMSRKYNMLMEAEAAASEAGLDMDTYKKIIINYENLWMRYSK